MTNLEELTIKDCVRARDGHKCVDCGMPQDRHIAEQGRRLDVHRLIPGSKYALIPG